MFPIIKHILVPFLQRHFQFQDRAAMKVGHPLRSFRPATPLPVPALPVDWTKANQLIFPVYGNDRYGDCMYAAAVHIDQTLTGNVHAESSYDGATVVKYYLKLAGADVGLSEGQITTEWHKGLCGDKSASILDVLDIDTTNASLMQSAIYLFGSVLFMLDVPDRWINGFVTDGLWDVPATADRNNGHGICLNGINDKGNYRVQTWGSHCWLTPAGVLKCDPSGFVVFSLRWFNANGIAPNGLTYDQLASLWVQAGGKPLPPNPFTQIPTPTPTPTPTPVPPAPDVAIYTNTSVVKLAPGWSITHKTGPVINVHPHDKQVDLPAGWTVK